MTTLSHYGELFRDAYAALHGGREEESAQAAPGQPGESLEEFLARSRRETLGRLERRLAGTEPPEGLERAHRLLLGLLRSAQEADAALLAQIEAYRRGQFRESMGHSDRLQELVSQGARLDRELMAALREAEQRRPGTLSGLGIADVVRPEQMG